MPIHDLSYRAYRGELSAHTWRWLTIAEAGLRGFLGRKLVLVFLFITYIHPIVRGVFIWASHQIGADPFAVVDANFFRQTLYLQGLFLILLCIWPGASLIAHDLRTNAIQLYLSKPLTRVDYVLGKFAIIAGIGALIMTIPGLLLFLMELGLSSDTGFIGRYYWVPLSVLGYSIVVIGGAALLTLAASSITRSARYAGLLFFALVFISQAAAGLLRLVTGEAFFAVLSLPSLVDQVGAVFFGGEVEDGLHPVPSLAVYLVLIGGSLLVLRWKVKAVEIVT